jgi:hypothetical protein
MYGQIAIQTKQNFAASLDHQLQMEFSGFHFGIKTLKNIIRMM